MDFFIGLFLAAMALWLVYLAGRTNGQNSKTGNARWTDPPSPSPSARAIIPAKQLPHPFEDHEPPSEPIRLEDIPRIQPDLLDTTDLGLAAIIDTETTGLANLDEIIEIAIAILGFNTETLEIRGVADFYVGLREPSRPINRYAAAANGFKVSDLRGHRLDTDKIRWMIQQSTIVIAHNAKFDHRFVSHLLPNMARRPWFCTMRGIDWSQCPSRRLQDVAEFHGFDTAGMHCATNDVQLVISLLRHANGKYFSELLASQPVIGGERKSTAKAKRKSASA